MPRIGPTLMDVDRCPQCGVASPNLSYKTHVQYPYSNSTQGFAWIIYQCGTCYDVVCAKGSFTHNGLGQQALLTLSQNVQAAKAIVPSPRLIDNDLPERPRRCLEQAIASLHAPDGAIMLAGSAIDAMLKIKGFVDGSVYSRIENAVQQNILTGEMRDWAHAVRLESNRPRHADLDAPHGSQALAEQTIGFAEALGEYLFALPARIQRGRVASQNAIKDEAQ